MAPLTTTSPLLEPAPDRPSQSSPNPEIMVDLVEMAFNHNASNLLSSQFHGMLASQLGKPGAEQTLLAVQELICRGEAAGSRFLAAFLDISSPGARLIPRIKNFSSSRRVMLLQEKDNQALNPFQSEWARRARQVSRETTDLLSILDVDPGLDPDRPGHESPWPAWRRCFRFFLDDVVAGLELMPDSRKLMAEMVRLETDAWQERTSRLAGIVNPFNAVAVQRLLPILSSSDSQVQDLRQMVSWIEAGDDRAAFTNQVSCAMEVMDERDHNRLRSLIQDTPGLAHLAALSDGLNAVPLEIEKLARGAGALLALTHQMVQAELREQDLGLFGCVRLIQEFHQGGKVRLPVDAELAVALRKILTQPVRRRGATLWPLTGIRVVGEYLVVDLSTKAESDHWENFLPILGDTHPRGFPAPVDPDAPEGADEEEDSESNNPADMATAAIKHLVMSNIMSTSVTLGFLRNPKVIAIPGLVGEVATRTRNPQIIETIATDRTLYTGFANRDVPRICLTSPCNTSVRTLRKFIHVKYVNKVDLKRMAVDKAGMRREVIREIENYLESLA